MSAIGTSYKLGKNLSALAEIEYRNFTVHGKSKETKFICRNGVDKLNMSTNFRQASYAAIHTYDYVDRLDGNSNNSEYNAAGYDSKTNEQLSSTWGLVV
jgi:fructose/tagatose bisphosphate aldolase